MLKDAARCAPMLEERVFLRVSLPSQEQASWLCFFLFASPRSESRAGFAPLRRKFIWGEHEVRPYNPVLRVPVVIFLNSLMPGLIEVCSAEIGKKRSQFFHIIEVGGLLRFHGIDEHPVQ